MAQSRSSHTLYHPDKEAWLKYFMDMAQGASTSTSKRINILKSASNNPTPKETPQTVNLVTEAAQGAQIAKSEIRQEEQDLKRTPEQPPRAYRRAPPSKRKKPKLIKSEHPDIFH